jgi:hypothetical protein
MKNIPLYHKLLVLGVLSLVAACALYWIIERAIDQKTADLVDARDVQARALFEKNNTANAQNVLDVTTQTRALLKSRLLSIDEPLEFLALVDDVIPRIAGAPTEVKSISEEVTKTEEKSKKDSTETTHVRVALSAEGDWNNVFHLLLLLEHIPYAVSMDRVVLTRSDTGGDFDWEADIFLTGGVQE